MQKRTCSDAVLFAITKIWSCLHKMHKCYFFKRKDTKGLFLLQSSNVTCHLTSKDTFSFVKKHLIVS